MAYLETIVKAHRSFIGDYWVTYDTCFHQEAAISKLLDWGIIDFTLYNETFTGRAKAVPVSIALVTFTHHWSVCTHHPPVLLPTLPPLNSGHHHGPLPSANSSMGALATGAHSTPAGSSTYAQRAGGGTQFQHAKGAIGP